MDISTTYTPPDWHLLTQIHAGLSHESDELARIFRYVLLAHHDPHTFAADEFGRTPIHYAVQINCRKALEQYLQAGVYDINRADHLGETALHRACQQNNIDMTSLLLAHGASPNHSTALPPLLQAVLHENTHLVECLLICGADPRQRLENAGILLKAGETALSLAVRLNTLTNPAKSAGFTPAQLDIVALLMHYCSEPSYVFHALQHAKQPLMKEYIKSCMRV